MSEQFVISPEEARRRLEELQPVAELAHLYSRVDRKILMPDGSYETDGDHVVQLGLVSMAYVSKYHPELDTSKVIELVLIHDVVEAIVGDVSTLGVTPEFLETKAATEAEGIEVLRGIFKDFPYLMQRIDEYEAIASVYAALVKGMDKVVPGYAHIENGGDGLQRSGIHTLEDLVVATSAVDAKMDGYCQAFQDVIALRQMQHVRVAQFALNSLQSCRDTISADEKV